MLKGPDSIFSSNSGLQDGYVSCLSIFGCDFASFGQLLPTKINMQALNGLGKGNTSRYHQLLGSMLIFGGVFMEFLMISYDFKASKDEAKVEDDVF